jgi:hypothetical protein
LVCCKIRNKKIVHPRGSQLRGFLFNGAGGAMADGGGHSGFLLVAMGLRYLARSRLKDGAQSNRHRRQNGMGGKK